VENAAGANGIGPHFSRLESLYKALSIGAHPRYETIAAVLHALGVKFAVVAERSQPL
jgi:DNA-binding phage protein